MVEQSEHSLTDILKAASDPTRRAILTLLAQHGPTRVTELAARFDISLNAVSKHIKVLESAGLVSRRTLWREHLIEVRMAPLAEIDHWFAGLRSIWDLRLEALATLLTQETKMTDQAMTDLSLTVRKLIAAPADRVYQAWLDPKMMMRFMQPGPGMSTTKADTDAKVGGRFALIMSDGKTDIPHSGRYLDLKPHSRIAFTWESPFSSEGSAVTLDFEPQGPATMVTLTHVRFNSEQSRDNHKSGWTSILDNLAAIKI